MFGMTPSKQRQIDLVRHLTGRETVCVWEGGGA